MAGDARDVVEAIRTALRGVSGLSTERVHLVAVPTPPVLLPSMQVFDLRVSSTLEGAPLGMYRRTVTLTAAGYVGGASATDPGVRALAALDLLDLCARALEADRTLGGKCYDLTVEGVTVDGEELGVPQVGACVMTVEAWWNAPTGI